MLESELFNLFEGTTDAAFTIEEEEGGIRSWNKAAERLFGYSAKEALNKTCYELFEGFGPLGTRVCHEHCSVVECAGKGTEIPNFDMSVKTRSGQRIWINMSTIVFDNPRTGRRLLIHLAHDIGEQKKSEELVHKMLDLSRELTGVGESAVRAAPAPALSDQEKHVLRLFAEGNDSPEVAQKLGITAQTLRNHLHHINRKLRTHNRLEAVMNAIQRKLI
ncbi:MAG TPA: LuxR C-terminal-related transcriptional regulator [Terriglobales bacterium]|jgi:PAS domain S-box-containing protein|nr:LuxR C-terminal-related transcriptional regulator [Terriglobales bacterium]